MQDFFSIQHLSYRLGNRPLLQDLSLEISPGQMVAVYGPNGSGKSSLFRLIIGLEIAQEGEIWFAGKKIQHLPVYQRARMGITYVAEDRGIWPDMLVGEHLKIGGKGLADKVTYEGQLAQVLQLFPLLKARFGQRAGTLSGGEQQMLALGRALISKPQFLLIDELSQGLAPQIIEQVFVYLQGLKDEGVSVFVAEPVLSLVETWADRVFHLTDGRLIASVD
ncbi:MAG: ATP-binding cassette domain-containing protein [Bacteroidota bacterium]